jgi:hypothetical protein
VKVRKVKSVDPELWDATAILPRTAELVAVAWVVALATVAASVRVAAVAAAVA